MIIYILLFPAYFASVASGTCSQFTCTADKSCVRRYALCDGIDDCTDGSDELSSNCLPCTADEFECTSGFRKCVPEIHACDDEKDCSDGSDEKRKDCSNVTCPKHYTKGTYACYRMSSGKRMKYNEAKNYCENLGAALSVFRNWKDFAGFRNFYYAMRLARYRVWIAGTYDTSDGKWKVKSKGGNTCEMPYLLGSDISGSGGKTFLVAQQGRMSNQVDQYAVAVCQLPYFSVCFECPKDEGYILRGDACYRKAKSKKLTYLNAKQACEAIGAALSVFRNRADFLAFPIEELGIPSNQNVWVAGTDEENEGIWKVESKNGAATCKMPYSKFHKSYKKGSAEKNYNVINSSGFSGFMYDAGESMLAHAVCQIPKFDICG